MLHTYFFLEGGQDWTFYNLYVLYEPYMLKKKRILNLGVRT